MKYIHMLQVLCVSGTNYKQNYGEQVEIGIKGNKAQKLKIATKIDVE